MTHLTQLIENRIPVMLRIGALEIVLIALIVLVLFGGSRLAGLGKSLGQSIREFKDEMGKDKKPDDTAVKKENTDQNDASDGQKNA